MLGLPAFFRREEPHEDSYTKRADDDELIGGGEVSGHGSNVRSGGSSRNMDTSRRQYDFEGRQALAFISN